MTRWIARYAAYLVFAIVAIVLWPVLFLYVAYAMPYPLPQPWERVIEGTIVWGAMPLTALAFIPYRAMIRRKMGAEQNP